MTTELETLRDDFETYGVTLSDELTFKCQSLCEEYCLKGEDIAASWIGYAATNNLDEVTIESLENFAQNELAKNKKKKKTPLVPVLEPSRNISTNFEDDLLSAYSGLASTPSKIIRGDCTPDTSKAKKLLKESLKNQSQTLILTPEVTTPSEKYSGRSNAGHVVTSYGSNADAAKFKAIPYTPQVSVLSGDGGIIKEPYPFMFEKMRDCGNVFEEKINLLADQMKELLNVEEWIDLSCLSNEGTPTVGTICCDSVGRLNAASVLLEGCREVSDGESIPLDLSALKKYSLFPGQVVAVKGVNSNGHSMLLQELQEGRTLPLPNTTIEIPQGSIQIMIASGPFTSAQNLLYEPLQDLLDKVIENPPHILILVGSILDASHPHVVNNSLNETFSAVVAQCVKTIYDSLEDTHTQLIFVSSSNDVTSPGIYPTPPYNLGGRGMWLSDPSFIDVDGVVIALTSTDVLKHLGKEEISFPPQSGDRFSRLARHLFAQQSLYPLYPPPEGMAIDIEKVDTHAKLTCTPHVLILPSEFRGFVKDVEGCVVVNPEKLAKGAGGGCYARMELMPPKEKQGSLKDSINAAVIKI